MDIAAADKYITGVYLYYLTVGEYLLYFTLCSEVILCILTAESRHHHCLIAYIKIKTIRILFSLRSLFRKKN